MTNIIILFFYFNPISYGVKIIIYMFFVFHTPFLGGPAKLFKIRINYMEGTRKIKKGHVLHAPLM